MESEKKSIKKIIESQKIEKIDSDFLYKIIAFIFVAILLYISYITSRDGLEYIPIIGKYLNIILECFNRIIYYLAKLLNYFLG
jgi:cell shape-determining protein MreC